MRFIQKLFATQLVAMIVSYASAFGQTPLPDCSTGTKILSSGNYILSKTMGPPNGQPCFSINRTSNITIDGNRNLGFVINTVGSEAVRLDDLNTPVSQNILIKNLKTNGSIYMNGSAYQGEVSANHITIEDSEFSELLVYAVDDLTIQRNHLRSMSIDYLGSDTVFRANILNNIISETNDSSSGIHYKTGAPTSQLVYFVCTKTQPTVATNWRIEGNQVHSIYDNSVWGNPGSHPLAMTIRGCRGAQVKDNTIEATAGDTYGFYFRDGTADGIFSGNRVISHGAAVHSGSGSFPGTVTGNTFTDNTFYSTSESALAIQNIGTGNSFIRNSIVSTGTLGNTYATFSGVGTNFTNNTFVNLGTGRAVAFERYAAVAMPDRVSNNIFSFIGPDPFNLGGFSLIDHDSNTATPTVLEFYTSYYSGNYNVFNSRNSQGVLRERNLDDQNSKDLAGAIFQSLDPNNSKFLRLEPNADPSVDPCRASETGTFVGRYSCSDDQLAPMMPKNLSVSGH